MIQTEASQLYDQQFYDFHRVGSTDSAQVILPLVLKLLKVTSLVDVGCGIGTWLSAAKSLGIGDVLGLDGDWVDRRALVIDDKEFIHHDLRAPSYCERRFDLALCMEVAEHLPKDTTGKFVAFLAQLSDHVLFSAAIPYQSGTGHINPQWQSYWVHEFGQLGFVAIDAVRPHVWRDPKVQFWYAQNALLFVRQEQVAKNTGLQNFLSGLSLPIDLVHPRCLLDVARESEERLAAAQGLRHLLKNLPGAAHRAMRDRFRGRPKTDGPVQGAAVV